MYAESSSTFSAQLTKTNKNTRKLILQLALTYSGQFPFVLTLHVCDTLTDIIFYLHEDVIDILLCTDKDLKWRGIRDWTSITIWSFHAENCVLGSCYCLKSKYKGGVCIFVHNSIKFASIGIDNYCSYQDFKACAINLNSKHDKLCILAT